LFREVVKRQLVKMYVAQKVQLVRQRQQRLAWQQLQHPHDEYVRQYLCRVLMQDLLRDQMQAFEQLE
jgi:hypothetical protein